MEKKITMIFKVMITAAMFFLQTGCSVSSSEKKDSGNNTQEKINTKEKRDDVVIYSEYVTETLDQHESVSVATAIFIRNLYANLYRLDSSGNVVPELAENYSVNSDYTEYTIRLKDGIQFSDGTPITAEDVAYTYNRGMNSEITYYDELKEVRAEDDKTVDITLNQPNNDFMNDLTVEYMCVMSKKAIEGGMDVAALPNITSGAYSVEKWNPEESIVLKANPYYFDGEPAIKKATVIFKLPKETAYQALKNKDVDYLASVSIDQIPYLQGDDDMQVFSYDNYAWNFLMMNEQDPHFRDQYVRNAIYHALDLDYIIEKALEGRGTAAPLPVNASISGYVEGYDTSEFDLNKAKECMAMSSYPEGFDMTIKVSTDERENVAEVIGTLLSEIGITIKIEKEEQNQLLKEITERSYETAIISYSMSSGTIMHAEPLFRPGSSLNFSGCTDSRIFDLLEKACGVNKQEKNEYLSEAYQQMKDRNDYIGLYWPTVYDAKTDHLKQLSPVTSEKFIIANMYWQ